MASQFSLEAREWLHARLSADATLDGLGIGDADIYDTLAPPGTSGVYVVYQYQGGFDINGTGLIRIMGSLLFTVKVSGENVTTRTLKPIGDRVDTLLQVEADYAAHRFACQREQELALPPLYDGDAITREIGGLYRILVHRI